MLLQGALKAVMRTASSEHDSKNGRLDRTLVRLDHTLDPARCAAIVQVWQDLYRAPWKNFPLIMPAFINADTMLLEMDNGRLLKCEACVRARSGAQERGAVLERLVAALQAARLLSADAKAASLEALDLESQPSGATQQHVAGFQYL